MRFRYSLEEVSARLTVAATLVFLGLQAFSQDSGIEKMPPLRPPRGEIPPSMWEQHSMEIIIAGVLVVVLIAALLWFLARPKPTVPVAPEAQARQELSNLRGQPETGALLSRVSGSVRRYAAAAFSLGPEEMTTTEFSRAVKGSEAVGIELADSMSDFLKRCDERKFAPPREEPPLGAADEAIHLVEAAEARREELRKAAAKSKALANDTAST